VTRVFARRAMTLATMVVVAGLGTVASSAPELDWKPAAWTIVVADDASASERYAAEEFQRLVERVTGATLPIASTPPKATENVFIGPGESMRASAVGFVTDDLGEEGLRIRIQPDNIAIAGGRPRGTLYGVYEFLERHLGVRFLTHDHTFCPEPTKTVRLPCEDYTYRPPFAFRWSYYNENATHPPFAARMRVNTVTHDEQLGGVARQRLISHSFYRYISPDKHGEEHPEYFALVDGERRLDIGGGGPEPCVTNPDVIRIISEGILADIRKDPTLKNIACSQNDNDAYCRCPDCEAINEREGTPMGANLHLVNAVADAVAKEFPDVKVGTLSYWYTRKPPETMTPRDNVQIQLCSIECCVLYPLNDPRSEKNKEFCEDMEAWGKICDDIWVWHYNTNFASYDLPLPNLRAIGPNVQFFLDNNVKGVFMQANGNGNAGEFSELRNYVIARCLWRPGLDSWDLVEEFCRLHYKEAAGPILDYLTFTHDTAQAAGAEPNCFGTPEEFGLTADVSAKALGYFAEALAATDDPAVRARVEKASICAYRAAIETGTELAYADGQVRLTFPPPFENVLDRYIELCREHNMTMAAETISADDYIKNAEEWRNGLPAARLENDTWELTFLPKKNAQLIEMYYKPAKRHLLAAWPRAGLRETGGTFQQWGKQGFKLALDNYEPRIDGDSLVLSQSFPNGTTVERTVTLGTDKGLQLGTDKGLQLGTDKGLQPLAHVRFETTIVHAGEQPTVYQLQVHPEWDAGTTDDDARVVAAYILDNGQWKQFNQDWDDDHGPDDALLETASGGGFAFFNHDAGFGLRQTYDPEQTETPRLWWSTDRHQVNLELMTRDIELSKGERFTFAYDCAYLTEPPG